MLCMFKSCKLAVAVQEYSPDSSLPNEWITTIILILNFVWVLISDCVLFIVMNPDGPVHSAFTVTDSEAFTTNLGNSTIQVRLTSDPIGQMGLTGSLVIVTVGSGTEIYRNVIGEKINNVN